MLPYSGLSCFFGPGRPRDQATCCARTSYVRSVVPQVSPSLTVSPSCAISLKMPFSEKDIRPAYSPIQDDQSSESARESDELLHDGYPTARPPKTSRKRQALIVIAGVAALLAYSIMLTTATSLWWKKQRIHGANVIDSTLPTRSRLAEYLPWNCSSDPAIRRVRADILQDDRDVKRLRPSRAAERGARQEVEQHYAVLLRGDTERLHGETGTYARGYPPAQRELPGQLRFHPSATLLGTGPRPLQRIVPN